MDNTTFDTGDFMELMISHLLRDPVTLAKAQEIGLKGDDFVLSDDFGINIYKVFVETILEINSAPIDAQLFCLHLKPKIKEGKIFESQIDTALTFLNHCYTAEINSAYFASSIKPFIKHRREEQAKHKFKDNNDKLRDKLNELAIVLNDRREEVITNSQTVNPFKTLIKKPEYDLIRTGFNKIDDIMCGLGRGEYGIIIGYSGGGKTAFGTNICSNNAILGINATYLSLEESLPNICNRFYSRHFNISYSSLHNGRSGLELEQAFIEDTRAHRKLLEKHLVVEGLKELAPLTVEDIKAILEKNYEKTGFQPDVVVLDQMQFLAPLTNMKDSAGWELERKIAKECDELSHFRVGGKSFALWVLHQAKGRVKHSFTTQEIDGFKGIIHSADTVLGIGREDIKSSNFNIFSLKSRHSKNFEVDLYGQLEFMNFMNADNAPMALDGYQIPSRNPIQPQLIN